MITTQRHEHERIQQQERPQRADRPWPRIGAACGLAFVLLQSVALGCMSSGGWLDPGAAPAAIVTAFAGPPSRPLWIGAYLSVLAALCFIPFTARVTTSLRRADVVAGVGWLPTTALAGGWLLVAVEVSGAGAISALLARAGHALSTAEALTLFDLAQALLFLFWAGGVIFLGAVAALSLTRRVLPRWLGGTAAVIAVVFLVAAPLSPHLLHLPATLFYLWVAATSVVLLRASQEPSAEGPGDAGAGSRRPA